ncbi:MAG: chorismate--pyruvate lyase [Lachnospiraceae bacterium]|mgnify:FL=1|nr:chorismate--pyruvate lyase [Lachnospiraceae bacterium]
MNTFQYQVVSIDGDYANLKRTDIESDELKLVARALLPPEITEGTRLLYEYMQYQIMDENIGS